MSIVIKNRELLCGNSHRYGCISLLWQLSPKTIIHARLRILHSPHGESRSIEEVYGTLANRPKVLPTRCSCTTVK